MSFIGTVKIGTNALGQVLCREDRVGFNNGTLAMDPFGFNGIEPKTLFGQKQRENPHAFARGLRLHVVLTNPGVHGPR